MQKDHSKPEAQDAQETEFLSGPESTEEASARKIPTQCEIDAIIRSRVHASLAVGLVPIPLLDIAALSTIQTELLYQICKVYGVPFKADMGKKIVGCIAASTLPVLLTPSLRSFTKYIPIVGFSLGAVSTSLAGAATTYALGHVFARHFASGGTLLDCDPAKIGAEIKSRYESSKETVAGWMKKKEAPQPAAV